MSLLKTLLVCHGGRQRRCERRRVTGGRASQPGGIRPASAARGSQSASAHAGSHPSGPGSQMEERKGGSVVSVSANAIATASADTSVRPAVGVGTCWEVRYWATQDHVVVRTRRISESKSRATLFQTSNCVCKNFDRDSCLGLVLSPRRSTFFFGLQANSVQAVRSASRQPLDSGEELVVAVAAREGQGGFSYSPHQPSQPPPAQAEPMIAGNLP